MRIVVTGAAGLFGNALAQVFSTRHEVFALTHAELDITDAGAVRAAFARLRPEAVVHPAGIPDLDICEAEPGKAFLVNFHGTRHVAEAAREVGAGMVYISTDAVFDGTKQSPYRESDPTIPPTVYGRTKLRGEQIVLSLANHWIFRVSLLFGPGKTNFVEKALQKLRAGERPVVASDQLGSATYTVGAAQKIMEVVEARRCGLYHLSNQGACSRLELAQEAARLAGLDPLNVIGKPSAQMGRRGVRLKYAVMEMAALKQAGFELPRPWQAALADYVGTRN
ncbi:MAG: NAD(P)-dependent oxidoreductase [Terriglobia bacterium]|jgi:dTDP-4-dehydrorhamnose reductase